MKEHHHLRPDLTLLTAYRILPSEKASDNLSVYFTPEYQLLLSHSQLGSLPKTQTHKCERTIAFAASDILIR
jgi:hypothetical protein